MKWRTIPFVRLLSPLLFGISLTYIFSWSVPYAPFILCIGLIIWLYFCFRPVPYRWRWMPGLLLFGWLTLFIFQLTQQQDLFNRPNHYGHFQPECLVGQIQSIQPKADRWQIYLEVQQIHDSSGYFHQTCGLLQVAIPRNDTLPAPQLLDTLLLHTIVSPMETSKNPYAFDYAAYKQTQGIRFQAFASLQDRYTQLPNYQLIPYQAFNLRRQIAQWRSHCIHILRKHIPQQESFAVAVALILGSKTELSEEVKNAYSSTGAIHVLAVSGLHVGMVAMILQFFLTKIQLYQPWWKWLRLILQLTFIWLFVLFTGASASVMRAGLMFSLLLLGKQLNESANIYNTIAASAFCLLVFNPYLLVNVGFQLSYLAVLGIVFFHPILFHLWTFNHRPLHYAWNLTCVSLAAQLSTLPLSLYYFHQFPTYFWLSGLVVVPAAMLILSLGILLLVLHAVPFVGSLLGLVLDWIIGFVNGSIYSIQQLPYHLWTGIYWPGWLVALYLGCMLVSMFYLSNRDKQFVWPVLIFSVILCGQQAHFQWSGLRQNKMTVYHIRRSTAIDFFEGHQAFTYSKIPTASKSYFYAADNFHIVSGIRSQQTLSQRDTIQQKHFYWHYPFFQLGQYRGLVLDQAWPSSFPELHYAFLLLSGNAKLQLEQLLSAHSIGVVILDDSVPRYLRKRWLKICESCDIPCYDISLQSAFIFSN